MTERVMGVVGAYDPATHGVYVSSLPQGAELTVTGYFVELVLTGKYRLEITGIRKKPNGTYGVDVVLRERHDV